MSTDQEAARQSAHRTAVGVASGMVSGTRVATASGWRPVETILQGDKVLTFDAGMQEVSHVSKGALWRARKPCPQPLWPLDVPSGAIGNAQPMTLLPEQSVVVESDVGAEIYGDPFTLLPASALAGFRGIARVMPAGDIEVATLHFAADQVIFCSAGALFFCPSRHVGSLTDPVESDYTVLSHDDAAFLIGCITLDERYAKANDARRAA